MSKEQQVLCAKHDVGQEAREQGGRHLPHGEAPLSVEQLDLVPHQLLELGHDQAPLLLYAPIERHRLRVRPQPRMQLPV